MNAIAQNNVVNNAVNSAIVGQILAGKNPRHYFDPVAQAELEESVRTQGLLQPILVRKTDDGLVLVAGERRLRAFTAVFGVDASIPVLVRQMTDDEADRAALVENVIRENMTPVEEAEAASRVLGQLLGNRDEAAKVLGWSRSILDKRLALMYGSDKVREALQNKKILLGHAELLCACRKESQDAAIDHLLKQEKMMTVPELRAYLESMALSLDGAIFDKSECTSCHHNSGNQSTLFAEAISGGRCTNKLCFDAKTEAQLNAQAEALKDEYQVIRIVRPGDNLTVIPLNVDGAKGVGQEQATACKVCKDYGAVISAVPDKMGREFKGMCMNVPCNDKLVAARQKAAKEALKAAPVAVEAAPVKVAVVTLEAVKQGVAKTEATTKVEAEVKAEAKPTVAKAAVVSAEPTGRVKDYRESVWRQIFQRAVAKLGVTENRSVLMAICMTRPSVLSSSKLCTALESVLGKKTQNSPAAMLTDIMSLEQAQLGMALNSIAACVDDTSLSISDVAGILKFFEIKIEDYWKIDKAFFELLTKNEIDAVCEEIGVATAIGATGVSYSKLKNGSKSEFITAITTIKAFDYRGRVPKMMSY